jgi:hypothetical protein
LAGYISDATSSPAPDAPPVAVAVAAPKRTLLGHVWQWLDEASWTEVALTGMAIGLGVAIGEKFIKTRRSPDGRLFARIGTEPPSFDEQV